MVGKRRLEAADEEGFQTLVRRRRPRHDAADPATPTAFPKWRLEKHSEASAYAAIRWLEDEQKVQLRVDVTRTGDFVLRGADWAASTTLQEVASGQPRGIVLKPVEPTRKAVLEGFPAALPLDPVQEHPIVAAAERCTHNAGHGRRLPTRQVLVTLRGRVPAYLDLGCWGKFSLRPFVPEPVRCFRCQAFGHYQRQCRREKELCGVCSGDHATRDCLRRLRAGGERPAARCPNCGEGHHAWNRKCPARLQRIPGRGRAPREEATRPPPPPTPAPVQPPPPSDQPAAGRRRRRRRRKRRTQGQRDSPPPTAAMEVETSQPPVSSPAVEDLSVVEEEPPVQVATRSEQCTQTESRTHTFTEADLVGLLINYEFLVEQAQAARAEKCPHEPALVLARRLLRVGRPVPRTLPTQRSLQSPPVFYDHVGEPEWEDYPEAESEEDVDIEDLLLNTSRDLTDEEMARVLNV